jgi:hypothetical protein
MKRAHLAPSSQVHLINSQIHPFILDKCQSDLKSDSGCHHLINIANHQCILSTVHTNSVSLGALL